MRGETSEAFQARMEAKSAERARIRKINLEAAESIRRLMKQGSAPKPKKVKAAPPAPKVRPVSPTHCSKCGRKFVGGAANENEVHRSGTDVCRPCQHRKAARYCIDCGVEFRQTRADLSKPRHWIGGRCFKCHNRTLGKSARTPRPERCLDCGKKVRSQGIPRSEAPDTVIYSGRGYCTYCSKKHR